MTRIHPVSAAALVPILLGTVLFLPLTTSAHPASSGSCSTASGQRWYGIFRTYDLESANAKGGQAAWEEQDYKVYDGFVAGNRFVLSSMWVGFPTGFVEVGFKRTPECNGNCFYRARRISATDFRRDYINKVPHGAHTWHLYKLEYSPSNGTWGTNIDGQYYGGYGGLATSAVRMTVGLELTSNCSIAHTTYFGSPSTSSSYAFRYKTGSGLWTTWGSGVRSCDGLGCNDPNAHASWLTWAIYGRAWADGYGGY